MSQTPSPSPDRQIILIAHNLRSCHNVGSLLRTAEGLGVHQVICSGYTPYPLAAPNSSEISDQRLPYVAAKQHTQISKTALGAETSQSWRHVEDIYPVLSQLRQAGYTIAAIEQSSESLLLPNYNAPDKLVLIVGREVEGIEPELLAVCDLSLEIPMYGTKESFNVVQAAAMALYQCRFR